MDADGQRRGLRIDYLKRLFMMAAECNATCFSFWAGRLDEQISQEQADQRLADGIFEVLPLAENCGCQLHLNLSRGCIFKLSTISDGWTG